MNIVLIIALVFMAIYAVLAISYAIYDRATKKYKDVYTLTMYFGRKGCGKSTTMQKLALQHINRGWHVYADAGSTRLKGVEHVDGKHFYEREYPPHSLILLDESVIKFNNRNWKDFEEEAQNWFVEQRKHKCKVIMFANTFSVDSKIRDMNDYLVLCRKWFRVFMVGQVWYKIPVIITAEQSNREACECNDYKRVPWFMGGLKITYIPRYIKHFDTNAKLSKKGEDVKNPSFEVLTENDNV